MLFKKIITLLIILGFSFFSYSQNSGKAYYKKTSTHNFEDIKGLDSKIMSSFKSVNNSINNMEFLLMFNDSLAIYEEIKKLEVEGNGSKTKFTKVFSGYNGPSYYNFKTKKTIQKQGSYLVEKSFTDYEWVLTKDKLIIDHLTCYKATTTLKLQGRRGEILRPVVAWYTTDINLSIGPDGFGGLPGLIIQLEVDKVVTTLSKIEFIDKALKIKLSPKGKKITEEEFNVLMKEMVENRAKYYDKN
jgi:GLPGLI family protein